MTGKLTTSQAADYRKSLRELARDKLEYHIFLMEIYGGWSRYTPHKIAIAYRELERHP